MIASFLAGFASLLLLMASRSLWQFWAVAGLMSLHAVSMTIGSAYVTDIVRKQRVGTGISFIQSCTWIGTVIGYMFSGIAFQHLGIRWGLAIAAVFPLLAILVLLIRTSAHTHERSAENAEAGGLDPMVSNPQTSKRQLSI
jgi:MFS family permease